MVGGVVWGRRKVCGRRRIGVWQQDVVGEGV